MAKAIEQVKGQVTGRFGLGLRGQVVATPNQAVHDGDTFAVRALGNFGMRFLGIDTPEVSFKLPGKTSFVAIGHADWQRFLADPFAAEYGALRLDPALRVYLAPRLGPDSAANHARHAAAAQAFLEQQVTQDVAAQGASNESFKLFLRFATDVVDRYGRLLAFVNTDQADAATRPPTYNERMLQAGAALPYFIWPNINPFRRQASLPAAVLKAGSAADVAEREAALRDARRAVAQARNDKLGIFAAADPLQLHPAELRFLAQRLRPNRWVIDLSSTGNLLRHPQRYFEIERPEDRLYVSDEHVEMFVAEGWVRQGV